MSGRERIAYVMGELEQLQEKENEEKTSSEQHTNKAEEPDSTSGTSKIVLNNEISDYSVTDKTQNKIQNIDKIEDDATFGNRSFDDHRSFNNSDVINEAPNVMLQFYQFFGFYFEFYQSQNNQKFRCRVRFSLFQT
jgi:hypothetical protein